MRSVIDAPLDLSNFAQRLVDNGVDTVIRYYNNRNSTVFPTKCLSAAELSALHAAGLGVAVVFQQRGGAGGALEDLSAANGDRDGRRAAVLAAQLGQPAGSAIYFAVDHDFFRTSELKQVRAYFTAARAAVPAGFRLGCYGSGTVGGMLREAGLIDLVWLAGARGWSGTADMLRRGGWALFQQDLDIAPLGFPCDGNIVNPTLSDFGQFGPQGPVATGLGVGSAALFRVAARSGLNLRAGPGESFPVKRTIAQDQTVRGLARNGDWIAVDLEGDAIRDGFMHADFLEPVSGGLPLPLPPGRAPIDVARAELALGVAELPGVRHHPRIVMYHATTAGGAASDETAWCASFANYCVTQAGRIGTNSKAARSWHDRGWGREVTGDPAVGDVVVWRRHAPGTEGGHVGFFIGADNDSITVLGGNQGNAVSITDYPRNGQKGSFSYTLLSIRRG